MSMLLFPILKSLSLAALSFNAFAFEGEVQKGENNRVSMLVGMQQAMLASILLETLSFIFPISLGVYTLLWVTLTGVPIVSAISLSVSSLYNMFEAELKKYPALESAVLKISEELKKFIQEYPVIKDIIKHPYGKKIKLVFDKLLLMCASNSSNITALFNSSYKWLGSVYFYGQAALFSIIAITVNPVFGLTGLAYFAVSALRSKAYLPAIVSKPLEKFERYVCTFSGLFQANILLKSAFFFNMAILGFQEIILPKILKDKLKDSDFLTVLNDDVTKKPEELSDVLKKNITLSEFQDLLFKDTNVSKDQFDVSALLLDENGNLKEGDLLAEFERVFNGFKKAHIINNKEEQSGAVIWKESKDVYVEIFILSMKSLNEKVDESINKAAKKYKENTWKNNILYAWNLFFVPFQLGLGMYLELYLIGNKLLTNMKVDKPFATTVKHLAQTPDHYLLSTVPQLNFKALKKDVRTLYIKKDGKIDISAVKASILKSVKFVAKAKTIDLKLHNKLSDLYARLNMTENQVKLDKETLKLKQENLKKQLQALHENNAGNNESGLDLIKVRNEMEDVQERLDILELTRDKANDCINGINKELQDQWRADLKLPKEATEDEILLAFMMENFSDVCDKIQTGAGLNNKTVSSIKYFQAMGTQVLARCHDLINSVDSIDHIFAEDMVRQLALEAGDFCATAMYDMVGSLYAQHRHDILEKAKKEPLSAKEKMQIFLQEERQRIVDTMLNTLNEIPFLPIFIDFRDRHVQSAILSNLTALNLPGKFNVNSDLSNDKGDFLSDMINKWLSYVIARQLMVIEHGYSPEHIVQKLGRQSGDGYAFNINDCMKEWKEKFEDPEVKAFIEEILGPMVFGDYALELRKKLCTLMLYDFGIIEKTNPTDREELPEDPGAIKDLNQEFSLLGEGIQALFCRRPGTIENSPESKGMPLVVGMLTALSSAIKQSSEQGNEQAKKDMQALQSALMDMNVLESVASLANKAMKLVQRLEEEAADLQVFAADGSINSKELGEFVQISYQRGISIVAECLGEQGKIEMRDNMLEMSQRMEGIGAVVAQGIDDAQALTFIDRSNGKINTDALISELPRFVQENLNRLHAFSIQSGLIETPANRAYGPDGQALSVFDMAAGDRSQPPRVEGLVHDALNQAVDYVEEHGIPSPEDMATLLAAGVRFTLLADFSRQNPSQLNFDLALPEAVAEPEEFADQPVEPAVFNP